MKNEKIFAVVPAYNESTVLGEVVNSLKTQGIEVVVIDDCSTDNTSQIAKTAGARVHRHPINLGQGAALQTGIDVALKNGADYVVTFDADGQHPVEAISRSMKVLNENPSCEVVLGSRFLDPSLSKGIPLGRKILLKAALAFTKVTTGLKITDTHNGFRVFRSSALKKFRIRQNRMAHASEILNHICSKKISFLEIPIKITYTAYSQAKGQRFTNAFNVLWELFSATLGGFGK